MLMKSRVFALVVCFVAVSQGLGTDEDGFQQSNYYTNDQGNNVGEIQNQGKNAAKRQDKKVEHFRNNHAKYHDPKRQNIDHDDRGANSYSSNKVAEGLEKRSQYRRGDSRVTHQNRGHFDIPSDRVQYHEGGISRSKSHPHAEAQRLVRKSFNEQNSNWRWGFRRKQAKDHKDTSGYVGGNYKSKESMSGRNTPCEAMVRNGHMNENGDYEGNARQNVILRESKMKMAEERFYSPRQKISEDQYRAMGQQNMQQWENQQGADGVDYQYDNIQKPELQPEAPRWHDGRNANNAGKFIPKEMPSYRNPHPVQSDAMRATDNAKIDYREFPPVETRVMNKPIENAKFSNGLLPQTPQNQKMQSQMSEERNNYEPRNEQFQSLPNVEGQGQTLEQYQTVNLGYENGLNVDLPRTNNAQPKSVKFDAQDAVPQMRGDDPNVENQWIDGPQKMNALRMKPQHIPNSKYAGGNPPELHQKPAHPPAKEIRYVVLSPAEFSPETLRMTLGEPEKPRGIPCCTLDEYKVESASLKAKSFDTYEKDLRYNGKGSINELISR